MVLVQPSGRVIGYLIKNNIKHNSCNPMCDILLNATVITETKNSKNKLFVTSSTLSFCCDWPNTSYNHIINATDRKNNQKFIICDQQYQFYVTITSTKKSIK